MASDQPRRFMGARENIIFFLEEMVWYVLRLNEIDLGLRRPEHMERLRAVALYPFCPSIGDAVIFVTLQQKERIIGEVNNIWNYARRLQRSSRGGVIYSSTIITGTRILYERNDPVNLFVIMSIVAHLCLKFCRCRHPALIGYAVAGLEYILNHSHLRMRIMQLFLA